MKSRWLNVVVSCVVKGKQRGGYKRGHGNVDMGGGGGGTEERQKLMAQQAKGAFPFLGDSTNKRTGTCSFALYLFFSI